MTDTTSDFAMFVDTERSRREITNLVINNNRATDQRNSELFQSLWHPDASYAIGGGYGDCVGIDEIDRGIEAIWAALMEIHHWTTNLIIEFSDPDHAHGESNVLSHCIDHDGRYFVSVADYLDGFERRDSTWRFIRRNIVLHYRKEVPIIGSD
jgi:hypothetical protein